MADVNGNGIQLVYTTPSPSTVSRDSLAYFIGGDTTSHNEYYINTTTTPYTLQSIQAFNVFTASPTHVNFTWTTTSSGQTMISSVALINGSTIARNWQFGYSGVVYTPTGFSRNFLRTFSDPGCSTPVSYQFAYYGETNTSGSYTTTLPDSTQNKFDYWGYYSTKPGVSMSQIPTVFVNPSNPAYASYTVAGTDANYIYTFSHVSRAADTANVRSGALKKISNAQGGSSNISYESNDFYNTPSGSVIRGNGIRVTKVVDSVGIHSTNNIVRNYTYLNPSTGISSGKPISLPQYAFTIPYERSDTGSTLWAFATVLSAHDMSGEDHTIMYVYSKMNQSGAGSTLYQYNIPATYFDASATPSCAGCNTAEWFPTVNYVARPVCPGPYGPIKNHTYAYPFILNPNYDFERGLPLKVTNFNETGAEVSESNYSYQRSYAPDTIKGFRSDIAQSVTFSSQTYNYNKYTIYYHTSELTTKVVNKVYDSQTLSQARTDSVLYTYGSAYHKLLTQQQAINSDGSVVTSKISYVKDYAAASGANPNVTALNHLKSENINIPVETYQQVTRAGTTKTTSAGLTLFKGVTPGSATLYLPQRQYKLVQPDGLTGFAPMTISGQTLTFDSTHYVRVANYDTYDKTGFPLTVDDNFKHIGTTFINHFAGQPIAVFSNCAYKEEAYADFDSDHPSPAYGFNITGSGSFTPVGSHAGKAAGLASTQTAASGTMTKNAIAGNYIFSIWINAATGGTLTLTLTGFSTHPTVSYTTGGWKYYEIHIPVGTLSSSYTVGFAASNNISIDDVLFYPDVAQATTATYDSVTYHKIAVTNTNGVSTYYLNDQWGRLLYTFDQDHNIVQKNTFITPADVKTFAMGVVVPNATIINGQPSNFTITGINACAAAGITVTWKYGDGTTITGSGLTSPWHTYHGINTTDTVKATIHSTFFGTKALSPVVITVNPALIPLSYTTFTTSLGDISSVTFTPIGSGTSYSFTNATLNSGHVLQGQYTINVNLSDGVQYPNGGTGAGYNSVHLDGSCYHACQNWVVHNNYSFTADISNCTSLAFTVYQTVCP